MSNRASTLGVVALILVPLILTAVVKYAPVFTAHPNISSISVLPTSLYGSSEFAYMQEDIAHRLREGLTGIPGIALLPDAAGADALILTALTVDSGLVQLNVQMIEAKTKRILYSSPFQSSKNNYPDMMRAATAALKRELQR